MPRIQCEKHGSQFANLATPSVRAAIKDKNSHIKPVLIQEQFLEDIVYSFYFDIQTMKQFNLEEGIVYEELQNEIHQLLGPVCEQCLQEYLDTIQTGSNSG